MKEFKQKLRDIGAQKGPTQHHLCMEVGDSFSCDFHFWDTQYRTNSVAYHGDHEFFEWNLHFPDTNRDKLEEISDDSGLQELCDNGFTIYTADRGGVSGHIKCQEAYISDKQMIDMMSKSKEMI